MKHLVFVDNTATGLLAFQTAKRLGCFVTFVKPRDSSFIDIAFKDASRVQDAGVANVDEYIEVSDLGLTSLRPVLQEINARRPIDAIVTTSEAAITAVAREAEFFHTRYPSYEALCNAVFKDRCRAKLRQAGLRSPGFEVLSEQQLLAGGPKTMSLPYVIKPTRGFGKQYSAICMNEKDVATFIASVGETRKTSDPMIEQLVSHDYLVEEYVRGKLYSAEIIVQDGRVSCFATTSRFRAQHNEMLEMTTTMPSNLNGELKAELVDYVQKVIGALGIDIGLYHVEIMCDADGPCLIEVNGRMIGGVAPRLYHMLSDVDPFELMLRLHLGERIEIDDSRISRGGTTVVVGARTAGRVDDRFEQGQLDQLLRKYDVQFSTLNLSPGKVFADFSGNLSLIGYVILLAKDSMTAARRGHDFLRELAAITGLDLANFNPLAQ